MTSQAKKDAEELINDLLPLARRMLQEDGEFYPYGGYIKWDGTIVHVGTEDPGTDRPKSKDLIYVLRSSFQEMARNKQCKGVALVFDVAVRKPHTDHKTDAIQVCVDHVDGYSIEAFFPYENVDGKIVYGQTFAQQGSYQIFPQRWPVKQLGKRGASVSNTTQLREMAAAAKEATGKPLKLVTDEPQR